MKNGELLPTSLCAANLEEEKDEYKKIHKFQSVDDIPQINTTDFVNNNVETTVFKLNANL